MPRSIMLNPHVLHAQSANQKSRNTESLLQPQPQAHMQSTNFRHILLQLAKRSFCLLSLHCSNGVGRSGTFTTIYSQVERIKAEQVADIFQYVKGIRLQRADMLLEEVCVGMWQGGQMSFLVSLYSSLTSSSATKCWLTTWTLLITTQTSRICRLHQHRCIYQCRFIV